MGDVVRNRGLVIVIMMLMHVVFCMISVITITKPLIRTTPPMMATRPLGDQSSHVPKILNLRWLTAESPLWPMY